MLQLKGRKEVILFDPRDNRKLYEAEIQEAHLRYNILNDTFKPALKKDSSSGVMSPVNVRKPDFEVCSDFILTQNKDIHVGKTYYL